MDLEDLRAFRQVVEFGSFQRAAAALRAPRTGLRRQVERLEAELQVALLIRGAQGIEPTPAGRVLNQGAAALLRDAHALADRARAQAGDARGVLRLVGPTGIPAAGRTRALAWLRSLHPELSIEVLEADDPLARIGEPFDLMLHFGDGPRHEGWFSHVILRAKTGLFASAAYLAEHGTPGDVDALRERVLLEWSGAGERGLPLRAGGTLATTPWLRTTNLSLLFELALQGVGLLYAPALPAAFTGGELALARVLEDEVGGTVTVRALSPRPSRVDPKVRALLENLQRLITSLGAEPEAETLDELLDERSPR